MGDWRERLCLHRVECFRRKVLQALQVIMRLLGIEFLKELGSREREKRKERELESLHISRICPHDSCSIHFLVWGALV
jgi:hypothetical protein